MDDNDVCPICCEELDISDLQFFPCKCGYQVCMWCWHRIKESESGLCPACRTPYGDDPHEFSAVDMEEVVKANKEKAAAEKREKERIRQQQAAAAGVSATGYAGGGGAGSLGIAGMHIGGGSDGDHALALSSGTGRGLLDPPKDRNQLANMRVIRRNLVYAVGLPPNIATEESLRKPEYFGEYGKISKIVINRNHNGNGDPRRASASAYVTFSHKEDTLACILALDGFYLEGRNIRASYGTSKYCSAFIKNVRCNNPDCTYLHSMGDAEDTFTKQEIQAGYVTSGRDVLARQQQIAAAATGGSNARRRVGSGGPSGTGKVTSNPVFPAPVFDEPSKQSQSTLVPPPPSTSSTTQFPPVSSASITRASSAGAVGFSTVAAAGVSGPSAASIAAGKVTRSNSLSASIPASATVQANSSTVSLVSGSNSSQKPETALTPAEKLSRQQEQLRKLHPQNSKGNTTSGQKKLASTLISGSSTTEISSSSIGNNATTTAPAPTTAASVVAGVHSSGRSGGSSQTSSHTTLTALTPLKRSSSLPDKKENFPSLSSHRSIGSMGSDSAADLIPLSSNIPPQKGLSSSDQSNVYDQRKENVIGLARQQSDISTKLSALRSGTTTIPAVSGSQYSNAQSGNSLPDNPSPSSSISSASGTLLGSMKPSNSSNDVLGGLGTFGSIGGTVIGGNGSGPGAIGSSFGNKQIGQVGSDGFGYNANIGTFGGGPLSNNSNMLPASKNSSTPIDLGSIGGSSIASGNAIVGGQTITGPFHAKQGNPPGRAIRSDSWEHENNSGSGLFGNSGGLGGISGVGIWGDEAPLKQQAVGHSSAGGMNNSLNMHSNSGVIGGGRVIGQHTPQGLSMPVNSNQQRNNPFGGERGSGSSALASMLGIELPTGSGSLRESLWASSTPFPPQTNNAQSNAPVPTPIGSGAKTGGGLIIGGASNSGVFGGVPIGGYGGQNGSIGNNNNNDIALLQSLLPGVHITSGNAYQPAAPHATGNSRLNNGNAGGWGGISGVSSAPTQDQQQSHLNVGVGGLNLQHQQQGSSDTWGNQGLYGSASQSRSDPQQQKQQHQKQQQQQHPTSIW